MAWVAAVLLLTAGCDGLSRRTGHGAGAGAVLQGQADGGATAAHLAGVLDRGSLPQSFVCSGMTWVAAGLGGFSREHLLSPVNPGIDGYTLLRDLGAKRDAPPRLFIQAGRRGPLGHLYVRYEPVP